MGTGRSQVRRCHGPRVNLSACSARTIQRLAAVSVLIVLPSCITRNVPGDIKVVQTECLPDREYVVRSDLPLPSNSPVWSRDVFRVTIRTALNLSEYVERHSYGLGVDVFTCDDPATPIRSTGVHRGQVGKNGWPTTFYKYHFYFYSSDYVPWQDNIGRRTYDLAYAPVYVCFRFMGGNETAFGYRSNVGRIAKSQIQALLAHPGDPN